MRTIDEIVDRVRRLRPSQRRELIERLAELEGQVAKPPEAPAERPKPYARTLRLAGSGHSSFTDVADDKYRHLAEAYADSHE